jgi:hypothetical protein
MGSDGFCIKNRKFFVIYSNKNFEVICLRNVDPYHLKTFFTWYNRLLDHAFITKSKKGYSRKLDAVGKLVQDIDFERNLLIVCNRDIVREVFLSGFMNLETLRSFEVLNMVELMDIYMGKRAENVPSARPDERAYESVGDLLHDVLCVTSNYFEVGFNQGKPTQEVVINSIMRRYEYVEKDPKKPIKVTWVFFLGTLYELKVKMEELYKFFACKADNPLYAIVDLCEGGGDGDVEKPNNAPKLGQKPVSKLDNFTSDIDF